jgi:hypothetical protein
MLGARASVRLLGSRTLVARLVSVSVAVLGMGATLFVGTTPARADDVPFAPKICTGGGTVRVQKIGPQKFSWSIHADGPCQERDSFDQNNPSVGVPILPLESVTFLGSGTSKTLGACGAVARTSAVVLQLKINVTITYTSVVTGETVVQHEIWSAPVTTFPVMTLFVTSTPAQPTGAGVVFSHIFGGCNNKKNAPSALFAFAEVIPGGLTG